MNGRKLVAIWYIEKYMNEKKKLKNWKKIRKLEEMREIIQMEYTLIKIIPTIRWRLWQQRRKRICFVIIKSRTTLMSEQQRNLLRPLWLFSNLPYLYILIIPSYNLCKYVNTNLAIIELIRTNHWFCWCCFFG